MHVLARCVLADGHNPQHPKILGDRLPVVITNNQHGEVILAVFAQCDGCSSHRQRPNQPPNDHPISCPSQARANSDCCTLDKEHQTYHELGRCPIAAPFSSPLLCDPVAVRSVSDPSLAIPNPPLPPLAVSHPRSIIRDPPRGPLAAIGAGDRGRSPQPRHSSIAPTSGKTADLGIMGRLARPPSPARPPTNRLWRFWADPCPSAFRG